MPPFFADCSLSNGGALLLSGATVVGSVCFGDYLWVGEYFKVLIISVIGVMDDASIALKSYVRFIIFSSES